MPEEQIIQQNTVSQPQSNEMIEAGLHFGHKTSKTHPKMKKYISGMRNTIHLIDIVKTKEKLDEALAYIKELKAEKKVVLLIGTKIQISPFVKEVGDKLSVPYVSQRWIGGTLTNFETIKKRSEYLKEMEKKREEGELEKYTKKEQLDNLRRDKEK